MRKILTNPYLLGAQGFIAGALFLWATPAMPQGGDTAPSAAVQLVPPVS